MGYKIEYIGTGSTLRDTLYTVLHDLEKDAQSLRYEIIRARERLESLENELIDTQKAISIVIEQINKVENNEI